MPRGDVKAVAPPMFAVEGGAKHKTIGSRAQVWHGTAKKTTGGLKKSDLMKNKHGRIVSKKVSASAKKTNRLKDFKTTKGKFVLFKKKSKKSKKKSKKSKKC